MSPPTTNNLDYAAAETAAALTRALLGDDGGGGDSVRGVKASDADNLITKALGVVAESGVFACGLFLLSKSGAGPVAGLKKPEAIVACRTLSALISLSDSRGAKGVQPPWPGGKFDAEQTNARKRAIIAYLLQVSAVGLPQLLLIREVWEQTLTYSRYMMRSLRERD